MSIVSRRNIRLWYSGICQHFSGASADAHSASFRPIRALFGNNERLKNDSRPAEVLDRQPTSSAS